MSTFAFRYFKHYKSLEPDPKYGAPDHTTVALLHRLNVIAYTAAASFFDIVVLFVRLTPEKSDQSLPSEFRIFDNLYGGYSTLMDASGEAHGAYAKYLLCCRHSVAPKETDTLSNLNGAHADSERDVVEALLEVRRRCKEMMEVVTQVVDCWGNTLIASVAPDCGPLKRQALLADLPSIQDKGQRNLLAFGKAYEGLADAIVQIAAARTTALAVDTAVQLPNQFQIALSALLRLESVFERYRLGFITANRDLGLWPVESVTDPVYGVLAAEENRARSARLGWSHTARNYGP
ncbi:hypothetical protein C8R47DRAFT_1253218 [Mycena vitilis]|nr:hypothetical protein C8R47DRAFT_1253218 [Mycena vitilis]